MFFWLDWLKCCLWCQSHHCGLSWCFLVVEKCILSGWFLFHPWFWLSLIVQRKIFAMINFLQSFFRARRIGVCSLRFAECSCCRRHLWGSSMHKLWKNARSWCLCLFHKLILFRFGQTNYQAGVLCLCHTAYRCWCWGWRLRRLCDCFFSLSSRWANIVSGGCLRCFLYKRCFPLNWNSK